MVVGWDFEAPVGQYRNRRLVQKLYEHAVAPLPKWMTDMIPPDRRSWPRKKWDSLVNRLDYMTRCASCSQKFWDRSDEPRE